MQPGQKTAKVQAWEQLGDYIINQGSERYLAILSELDDEHFLDRYENLLEYFRPRLSRSEIRAEINPLTEKIQSVYDALQSEPDPTEQQPEQG